jgi:ATP-dependent Clp protease ATP-binding subunit ClpA
MQKMTKLPISPHLQGIIKKAQVLSIEHHKNGIDVDLFFHAFMSDLDFSCSNIFKKTNIDLQILFDLSLNQIKKRKCKIQSDHLLPEVKKIFFIAESLCNNPLEMDYISPEVILISFFSDKLIPSCIEKYVGLKKYEEILINDDVSNIISQALVFCKGAEAFLFEENENLNEEAAEEEDWIDMFSENPILSKFAENLNLKAAQGKFDKIVDFDNKIDELTTILCRKKKPNAILVGPAGTGKTSLVEGLAIKIVKGEAPELLSNKVIYSVNLASMVAGTEYRGQFEKRLQDFVEEAKKYSNLILFIDEIHTLVGAGGGQNHSLEASNILKPELARGTISCIGASTIIEYTNTIKKDSALDRRFEKVIVKEPSSFQMKEILPQIVNYYEEFHGVKYQDEFINNIIDYCERFTPNKFYPDKAIDVIDHCGAQAKVNFWEVDDSIKLKQREIFDSIDQTGKADKSLIDEVNAKLQDWEEKIMKTEAHVKLSHLKDFFEKKKNPMNKTEINLKIFHSLKKSFVGQNISLNKFFSALNIANLGLAEKNSFYRPDCFLFYGKKSSGKTLFCKLLKEELQKTGCNTISYNGVEFSDRFAPYKIISDLNRNTSLAEKICIHPNSIILIDDFEKVDPSCFGLFSQILKEGRLQMNNGDIADFSNCKIIITCNIQSTKAMGFNLSDNSDPLPIIEKQVLDLVTEKIIFDQLNKKDLRRILFNRLRKIQVNLKINDINLKFDFKFIKEFVDKNCFEVNAIEDLNNTIELKIISQISNGVATQKTKIELS